MFFKKKPPVVAPAPLTLYPLPKFADDELRELLTGGWRSAGAFDEANPSHLRLAQGILYGASHLQWSESLAIYGEPQATVHRYRDGSHAQIMEDRLYYTTFPITIRLVGGEHDGTVVFVVKDNAVQVCRYGEWCGELWNAVLAKRHAENRQRQEQDDLRARRAKEEAERFKPL